MANAKIFEAIAAVMSDVGAVGKDATNTFDKYKYRSIDAVMNAMHPAMAKNRVFVTPKVEDIQREERASKNGGNLVYSIARVNYTFWTDDGSNVQVTVIGEGSDRGDKSINKAMSAAFKYALFQVFCIPTEEMIDSETESPEFEPKKPRKAVKKQEDAPAPEPEAEPQDELLQWAYAHPKETINNMQVERIQQRAAADGVPIETILTLYKAEDLGKLTNYKYIDIMNVHWDAVKAAGEKYKQRPATVNINDL